MELANFEGDQGNMLDCIPQQQERDLGRDRDNEGEAARG